MLLLFAMRLGTAARSGHGSSRFHRRLLGAVLVGGGGCLRLAMKRGRALIHVVHPLQQAEDAEDRSKGGSMR